MFTCFLLIKSVWFEFFNNSSWFWFQNVLPLHWCRDCFSSLKKDQISAKRKWIFDKTLKCCSIMEFEKTRNFQNACRAYLSWDFIFLNIFICGVLAFIVVCKLCCISKNYWQMLNFLSVLPDTKCPNSTIFTCFC